MKTNLYVIYDKMAQESGPIQMCKNDAVATRMFVNALSTDKSIKSEDYILYLVGSYDSEKMEIVQFVPMVVPIDIDGEAI